MASTQFKGIIFDLDGVITGTARVHGLAWESMFNVFLKKTAKSENRPFVPFDPDVDYLQYVDGKPRMEGVKSFLESRNIKCQLPWCVCSTYCTKPSPSVCCNVSASS